MNLQELKGKVFRRNVYGLSIWSDVIQEVKGEFKSAVPFTKQFSRQYKSYKDYIDEYKAHLQEKGRVLQISVKGNLSSNWYNINEIIIY